MTEAPHSSLIFNNYIDFKKISNIPIDTNIILSIDIKSKEFTKLVKNALALGFRYPVISQKVFDTILEYPHLFLYNKYNHNFGKVVKNYKKQLRNVEFCIKHYIQTNDINETSCNVKIVFDKDTINYLQNYTKHFKFRFGNKSEQREISGKFFMEPINDNTLKVFFEDGNSDMGESDKSASFDSLASFHTHPLEVYNKFSVCVAWPSLDDYCTFLHIYASGYGIFHLLSSVEGVYIITISNQLLQKDRKEISKNYEDYEKDIRKTYWNEYPECKHVDTLKYMNEIQEYITKINKLPYFIVKFVEWENLAKPIEINYKRSNGNCFIIDEQVKLNNLINFL